MIIKNFFTGIWNYIKRTDVFLWILIIAISTYSLLLLKSVSRATYSDYFRTQLVAIVLGMLGAIIISMLDYASLANYWHIIGVFCILIMLYTAFFGERIIGSAGVNASAWLKIFGRTFQTSELVKIAFLLTFSKHLDVVKEKGILNEPLQVILLFIHGMIPFILCDIQGDAGAGVVFVAMFIFMAFSAGVKLRYFLIFGALVIIAFPFLWKYTLAEYQKLRFTAVYNLDDEIVQMNEGYQAHQGRISIGSGQLFGQGLFNGPRVASNVVTFQQSDFIFSVAGEELGFLGCSLIILLLAVLMFRVLRIASLSRDDIGKYICFGFFGLIAVQSIANIGMCLAILPVMGVTLPFFSSGGSSAMCLYFGIGLIQSVYMRHTENDGSRLVRTETMKFHYKQMKNI